MITVSSTALADARAADAARAGGDRRPMLGIPMIVKDNIDTTGMPTTAGSLALAGSTPPDAFIVTRLEGRGCADHRQDEPVRVGELPQQPVLVAGGARSAARPTTPTCSIATRAARVRASGVASAADLATVAIGTETDGSIVCPSGQNGDVGIKPTLGLASRTGIVPISAEQDTAGPIARNVTDAAVVLGALTGVDFHDPATLDQGGHVYTDYTQFLHAGALQGARIGVWRKGNFGISPETDTVMTAAIARLKSLGATIVDPANIPIDPAYGPEGTALNYEFKHDIAAYLRPTPRPATPRRCRT